jgi:hypothetical protein
VLLLLLLFLLSFVVWVLFCGRPGDIERNNLGFRERKRTVTLLINQEKSKQVIINSTLHIFSQENKPQQLI